MFSKCLVGQVKPFARTRSRADGGWASGTIGFIQDQKTRCHGGKHGVKVSERT